MMLDRCNPNIALPVQIRNILAERIENSYYRPGRRLDSIRKLAREFEVSAVTIGEALKLLEKDAYVVCVSGSGTYVMEKVEPAVIPLRIVLAFPEESISRDVLSYENWAISSEAYRGLVAGAMDNHAEIHFAHFSNQTAGTPLLRQIKRVREYDAAVFLGPQLTALQTELAGQMPVYQLPAIYMKTPPGVVEINYDIEASLKILLRHVIDCGYRRIGTLSFYKRTNELLLRRSRDFRQLAAENGLEVPDEFDWRFPSSGNVRDFLNEKLAGKRPDFILCDNSELMTEVYQAMYDHGIKIGDDLGLAGIATGLTLGGLIPTFTYVRVPIFEITRALVGSIRNGEKPSIVPLSDDFLIKGQSTKPRRTG